MRNLKILVSLLLLHAALARGVEPFPAEADKVSIGKLLPEDFEASGIAWHSRRQEFFVVSDGGMLCSMTQTGQPLQYWNTGRDLEAVTVAFPRGDFIYLGVEDPDSICEFNISTGQITRIFDLTGWMNGPDNSGLEALTFVPRADEPEGGLFYAGMQETGQIFVFRLPIVSSGTSTAVTYIRTISSINGVSGISGLCYVPSQNALYAVYDNADLLRVMETDGMLIGDWDLPGKDQEGVSLKGRQLYICQDYGSDGGNIFRYAPLALLAQPDLDGDGIVDLRDLAAVSSGWVGQDFGLPDVDGDSAVGLTDLTILCQAWLAGR